MRDVVCGVCVCVAHKSPPPPALSPSPLSLSGMHACMSVCMVEKLNLRSHRVFAKRFSLLSLLLSPRLFHTQPHRTHPPHTLYVCRYACIIHAAITCSVFFNETQYIGTAHEVSYSSILFFSSFFSPQYMAIAHEVSYILPLFLHYFFYIFF